MRAVVARKVSFRQLVLIKRPPLVAKVLLVTDTTTTAEKSIAARLHIFQSDDMRRAASSTCGGSRDKVTHCVTRH